MIETILSNRDYSPRLDIKRIIGQMNIMRIQLTPQYHLIRLHP